VLNFVEIDEEILYSKDAVTTIDMADIAVLKKRASINKRKRIRLCAHPDVQDALHEMLIVHHKGNYVPPHKHIGKSESFHIIEGSLKIVLFSDQGAISDIIHLDASVSKGSFFYYRLSESLYHTVIPISGVVVFHETTNGPFHRKDMIIPECAPDDNADDETKKAYMAGLSEQTGVRLC